MAKLDPSKLRQRLVAIHKEMGSLLPRLLGHEPLLKAYLSYSPRTCGSKGCKCRQGERHPAWIVRIQQGREAQNRSVSEETFERLKPMAEAYRRHRAAQRQWRKLLKEANEVLSQIESSRLVDAHKCLEGS